MFQFLLPLIHGFRKLKQSVNSVLQFISLENVTTNTYVLYLQQDDPCTFIA